MAATHDLLTFLSIKINATIVESLEYSKKEGFDYVFDGNHALNNLLELYSLKKLTIKDIENLSVRGLFALSRESTKQLFIHNKISLEEINNLPGYSLNQHHIQDNLLAFCQQDSEFEKKLHHFPYDENIGFSREKFIKAIVDSKGLCSGMSSVFANCAYLEAKAHESKTMKNPLIDYYYARHIIARWNGKDKLTAEENKIFLDYLKSVYKLHFASRHIGAEQTSMDKFFVKDKKAVYKKEKGYVLCLTASELQQKLELLAMPNRLLIINNYRHTVGLANSIYFDPFAQNGEEKVTTSEQLLRAMHPLNPDPSQKEIYCISIFTGIGEAPVSYPSDEEVLSGSVFGVSKAGTCLHFASRMGDLSIMQYYLENEFCDVNAENLSRQTPFYLAAYGNHIDAMRLLVSYGSTLDESIWEIPLFKSISDDVYKHSSSGFPIHNILDLTEKLLSEKAKNLRSPAVQALVAHNILYAEQAWVLTPEQRQSFENALKLAEFLNVNPFPEAQSTEPLPRGLASFEIVRSMLKEIEKKLKETSATKNLAIFSQIFKSIDLERSSITDIVERLQTLPSVLSSTLESKEPIAAPASPLISGSVFKAAVPTVGKGSPSPPVVSSTSSSSSPKTHK